LGLTLYLITYIPSGISLNSVPQRAVCNSNLQAVKFSINPGDISGVVSCTGCTKPGTVISSIGQSTAAIGS
jgi:hypothetical protein